MIGYYAVADGKMAGKVVWSLVGRASHTLWRYCPKRQAQTDYYMSRYGNGAPGYTFNFCHTSPNITALAVQNWRIWLWYLIGPLAKSWSKEGNLVISNAVGWVRVTYHLVHALKYCWVGVAAVPQKSLVCRSNISWVLRGRRKDIQVPITV